MRLAREMTNVVKCKMNYVNHHELSGQAVHELSGQAVHKLRAYPAVNPISAGTHGTR